MVKKLAEEFFHTFNALLDKGSQIIISGQTPNKLKNSRRIKSRFSGGLVIDIQPPDYDLRYKIVKSKTEELKIIILIKLIYLRKYNCF